MSNVSVRWPFPPHESLLRQFSFRENLWLCPVIRLRLSRESRSDLTKVKRLALSLSLPGSSSSCLTHVDEAIRVMRLKGGVWERKGNGRSV